MISCPKCGVSNPEESRFCRACGAPLPGASDGEGGGRRCPMCGAMNPPDSVVCERCQARLVPLIAEESATEAEEAPEAAPPQAAPFSAEISPPAEGEPDWLAELRATMEEAEEPGPEETPPVEEVEVPEWLTGSAPPAAPAETAEGEEEVPEWLQEVALYSAPAEEPSPPGGEGAAAPEPPSEAAPPGREETEVPDWLREVLPTESPPGEEEGPPEWLEAATPSEAPEWPAEGGEETALPRGDEGAVPFTEVPPEAAETAESAASEIPAWLREVEEAAAPPPLLLEEEAREEEGPPAAEESVESMPTWLLEEAAPAEAPAEEAGPEAPGVSKGGHVFTSEEGVPSLEPGEVPDWLKELAPPAEETPAAPPLEMEPEHFEGLVPAEIPDWLQALRPREEGEAAEEPVETEGLLEGLRGTLPPSPLIGAVEKAVAVPSVTTKPASVARAELFQELLTRPVISPRRVEKKPRGPMGLAIQRLVVGLLVLVAILAPMGGVWLPMGEGPGSAVPAVRADVQVAYDTIETRVDRGTPVLVAVEYGPSEAEEVDLVARALLQHVLDRGGRLIFVSTRPEGPALADRLASSLDGADEARTVNLGYQPGGASGVQGLLADLARRPIYPTGGPATEAAAMEGVTSAEDVGLIVVLGGQTEDLLAWIEQTSARYPDLPLVAGISARVEVSAQPYLERAGAGALRGMVVGLPGTAVYYDLRGVEDVHLPYYLQAMAMSQWVVAALMVVGMVVFLVVGGKGR